MTPCVEWQGALFSNGYGHIGRKVDGVRREMLAHRFVFEQAHGPIPKGMVIMHTCDNRKCISLEHLRMGTQSENILDAVAKGRHSSCKKKAVATT
jgi:HNH endonuclease